MNYQKVYMNQIHSSSLLCQLAQMWRSQLVCDAYIRTGSITTKAHRVVLLAACPMLQSMEKASIGSHLEVRLTADIKQEAVNMFLQYLYEGFMLLTEENCKDVEKVARLLQVDSVIKCCADFYKCLETKTGNNTYSSSKYKYTSYDMLEFRHVRTTDLQKTVQDRLLKRASEIARPSSPTSKKQRLYRSSTPPTESSHSGLGQRADDTFSMSHSYSSNQQDPWDRVPKPGASAASISSSMRGPSQRFQQPSVIDIVEDSIELIHIDPGDGTTHQPPSQKGVAVSVASQMDNGPPNISIVSVTGNTGPPHGPPPGQGHSQRQPTGPTYHQTHTVSSTSHQPRQTSVSSSQPQSKSSDRSVISLTDPQISQISREVAHQIQQQEQASPSATSIRPPQLQLAPGLTSPHDILSTTQQRPPQFPFSERLQQSASKPFAAGSARQVPILHSGSSSTGSPSTVRPDRSPSLSGRSDSMDRPPSVEGGKDSSKQKSEDSSTASSADLMADITIVKVEAGEDTPSKEHKDSGQSNRVIDSGGNLSGDNTGGLDMHVDTPDEAGTAMMQVRRIGDDGNIHEIDSDIEELETTGDWGQDDNDDSSLSNDPNNPLGGFRDQTRDRYGPIEKNKPEVQTQKKSSIGLPDPIKRVLETTVRKMDFDMYGEGGFGHPSVPKRYGGQPIAFGRSQPMAGYRLFPPQIGGNFGRPDSAGLPEVLKIDLNQQFRKPVGTSSSGNEQMESPFTDQSTNPNESSSMFTDSNASGNLPSNDEVDTPEERLPRRDLESSVCEKTAASTKGPVMLKGVENLPGHTIVLNNVKNGKRCIYCQTHRIRTASGWRVKTNYKCETCDVALCSSEVCDRNCFILYHKEMFGDEIVRGKI